MKIGGKPPGLPSLSDLVQPRASAPGAAPLPKGPPSSSFAAPTGAERRFSARFLQGIEPRMMRTGLPAARCADLARHFGAMNRSELDREGRVVDGLLSGAHPKESLAVFGMLTDLGALVTKDGTRAVANHEGSWTLHPPGQDAIVLPDTAGAAHGAFHVARPGLLAAGPMQLDGAVARKLETVGKDVALVSVAVLEAALVAGAAVPVARAGAAVVIAALTVVDNVGPMTRAVGALLGAMGLKHEAQTVNDAATQFDQFSAGSGIGAAITITCAAICLVASMPETGVDALKKTLDAAGRSAAPSTRCDPAAERAAILAQLVKAGPAAMADVQRFAGELRGRARGDVLQALRSL